MNTNDYQGNEKDATSGSPERKKGKNMYSALFKELYVKGIAGKFSKTWDSSKNCLPPNGWASRDTMYPSKFVGIDGVSGVDRNTTVFLSDDLDLSLIEKIVDNSSRHYLEEVSSNGFEYYRVKWESLLTAGIPFVALDVVVDGNDLVEVKKNCFNTVLSTYVLGNYLEKKYGGLMLKNDLQE